MSEPPPWDASGQYPARALYQGQAGSWSAVPGFTPDRRDAVRHYEAAIGGLCRRDARMLAAGQLKPVSVDAPIARSGLPKGGAA